MLEILTISNSILLIWIISKITKKNKISIFGNKTIGDKDITKVYPNLQPISIVDSNPISNVDIRNMLLSLKDVQNWKVDSFSISDSSKMHFLHISSSFPGVKSVSLYCIYEMGKISQVEMIHPMKKYLVTPSFQFNPTTDKNIIDQFTIAIWPFYKQGSEMYNEKKSKAPSEISKYISDIVPKSETRDQKLDSLLK